MLECTLRLNPFGGDGWILTEQHVMDQIRPFRQVEIASSEAGGILLGFRRGSHLHVTDLTLPGAEDKRSRTAFYRSAASHQKIAMTCWLESNGTMGYLGEWHTHPQKDPSPSTIDIREWRVILSSEPQNMVFVIAGNDDKSWIGIGRDQNIVETLPV